jgi:hypothetical protein
MGYVISILVRLIWSLSIGLVFFVLGTLLFLILDIFFPASDASYKWLTGFYKWGSCHWFKGIRFGVETDDYDVKVAKVRKPGAQQQP